MLPVVISVSTVVWSPCGPLCQAVVQRASFRGLLSLAPPLCPWGRTRGRGFVMLPVA